MLLLCDGGGSNASNRYVFKYHLERLANRLGLEIRVAHYRIRSLNHVIAGCGSLEVFSQETSKWPDIRVTLHLNSPGVAI
jgi:hypothetical protein